MRHAADGFLRLSLDDVLTTPMVHVVSGLDGDELADAKLCGRVTAISGYTEWASRSAPRISLGWDWCLEERHGEVRCVRVGLPRSNVMLVDSAARDLGWTRSLEALAIVVDSIAWAEETRRTISERYPSTGTTYQKG